MKTHLTLSLVLAFCITIPSVQAHDYSKGTMSVGHPWARPTAKTAKHGAAYFTLRNTGQEPDTLVSATTTVADKTEVHEIIRDGDVLKMRAVEQGLRVEPGTTVSLEPGGYHIMLIGLKQQLEEGNTIPLTLKFDKAGTVDVVVNIEKGQSNNHNASHGHTSSDHK